MVLKDKIFLCDTIYDIKTLKATVSGGENMSDSIGGSHLSRLSIDAKTFGLELPLHCKVSYIRKVCHESHPPTGAIFVFSRRRLRPVKVPGQNPASRSRLQIPPSWGNSNPKNGS